MTEDQWVVKRKGADGGLNFPPGARFYSYVALGNATRMGSRVEAQERVNRHEVDMALFEVVKSKT
jgi:hypothetical protein